MTNQQTMVEPPTERRIFLAEVARVAPVTPHMVRITLTGSDLRQYESVGADQFLYVFLPEANGDRPRVEHDFTWDDWRNLPPEERQIGRYYTVRYCRPGAGELDLDFVLHGDGPATSWAGRADPGDPVALWGPRYAYDPPAETDLLILLADETGLPATGAIIESLLPSVRCHALIEFRDRSAEQPLVSEGDVEITWLHRGDAAAGSSLLEAVQSLAKPATTNVYVCRGAEFNMMQDCRKHLQEAWELDSARIRTVGYWRKDEEHTLGRQKS
jgi:NADPH-dependent ferric siderophore reductase